MAYDSSKELARERGDLEKADRDIIEGTQRLDQQRDLIARLAGQGHETGQARALLENFQQMLEMWRDHRVLILKRIAILERRT